MEKREFPNPFKDYAGEELLNQNGKLKPELTEQLRRCIDQLLEQLNTGLKHEDDSNTSIYTGMGGIAMLYLNLALNESLGTKTDIHQLNTALAYIRGPLRHLKGRRFSFACGDAGPLALGSVIYHNLGKTAESDDCIHRLEGLCQTVCFDRTIPDEYLYGRAGYLCALLYVQHHVGQDKVDPSVVSKVYKAIFDSGQRLSRSEGWKHPLMYQWHEKHYLGAAHGLAGIFYMLMQVNDPAIKPYLNDLVRPSIDFMLSLQFPSGNGPSSIGNNSDKLIHWCHGAPGWVHMFLLAYRTFDDGNYLVAARKCGEVIWERGLLKKGYGICHGTAGNAYAFLALFKVTQDPKYLYRAWKFAEWCFDYGKHGCRTPDTPYSMFEGMAGTINFLADMLNPQDAKFPGFQLW